MLDPVSSTVNPFQCGGPPCRPVRRSAATLSTLQASSQTSAELTIVTADGDRVTLSSRTTARIGYADFRYLSQGPGQTTSLQAGAADLSVSRDLQVSIEGDLSPEELRDIQKLVKRVERVVRDFLRGGDATDAGQALAIGRFGSLSAIGLSVEHEERVTRTAEAELYQPERGPAPGAPSSPD